MILTGLFLWPLIRSRLQNLYLRKVARRAVITSILTLLASVVNIAVLTVLHGHELGWLCLTSCGVDVSPWSWNPVFAKRTLLTIYRSLQMQAYYSGWRRVQASVLNTLWPGKACKQPSVSIATTVFSARKLEAGYHRRILSVLWIERPPPSAIR